MPCQISPALRQEITTAKSSWKLARLLEENNVMKIGVHILYPDNPLLVSAKNMGILASRSYAAYKQGLSEFLSCVQRQDDMLLLMEDMAHSPKIVSHFFAINEIIRTSELKFAYTPTGALSGFGNWPGWPDACEYDKANESAGNPEAIKEILKNADGLFFFGLYMDACILEAKCSLINMWTERGVEINTHTNNMVSKRTSDFGY